MFGKRLNGIFQLLLIISILPQLCSCAEVYSSENSDTNGMRIEVKESISAKFYPSGSDDIDRMRAEVKESLTTADNYRKRALLLLIWLGSVQQQSADTHPFFDIDKAYYQLQGKVVHGRGQAKDKATRSICRVVDDGYKVM